MTEDPRSELHITGDGRIEINGEHIGWLFHHVEHGQLIITLAPVSAEGMSGFMPTIWRRLPHDRYWTTPEEERGRLDPVRIVHALLGLGRGSDPHNTTLEPRGHVWQPPHTR